MKDSWENLELCNVIGKKKSDEFIINEDIIESESDLDIDLHKINNDDPLIMLDGINFEEDNKECKDFEYMIDSKQYDIIENKDFNFYLDKIKINLKNKFYNHINKKNIDYLINNKKYEMLIFLLVSSFSCSFLNLYYKYVTLENKYNTLINQVEYMQYVFFC
jgi:hypothetical protein